MAPHVIIVGGGLAGLAAGAALAVRGLRVTILESRPRWGGRASSIVDSETGETIDNCQHVSMGCCTNFDHFCRTVGIDHLLQTQTGLNFVAPNNAICRFAASPWPAPFHLLPAFRRLSYLSRDDLTQIRKGLWGLSRERQFDGRVSFAEWLAQHGQSPQVQERFWRVVLVSALSESLDRIDVSHARKVFVDGFLANRAGWKVRIPTVPLDELYGAKLTEWFAERPAALRLKTGVERIVLEKGRVEAVELRNAERIAGDHVILAVPYHVLPRLLPEPLARDPFFNGAMQLESAPISSVHLWYDRPITELPHAVFVERTSQWLFNRSAIHSNNVADGHYYQVVISASREVAAMGQDETVGKVRRELCDVWPAAKRAELRHSRLITEHKAVFSPVPGVDELRPGQQTPVANLQLAGDWTATGWPATMEGAVRGGYLAAENVLRHLGRNEPVLRPDLPTAFLSKLLLRL
ncbi:MAG: hydroxysqualene dehydroxylase HpnE [Planctomycetaceae bacterium]